VRAAAAKISTNDSFAACTAGMLLGSYEAPAPGSATINVLSSDCGRTRRKHGNAGCGSTRGGRILDRTTMANSPPTTSRRSDCRKERAIWPWGATRACVRSTRGAIQCASASRGHNCEQRVTPDLAAIPAASCRAPTSRVLNGGRVAGSAFSVLYPAHDREGK
jgi:hypothetical protein